MENRKAFEATLKKESKSDKRPMLVRLDPKADAALRASAKRLGISAPTIIRALVQDYLEVSK